MIKSENGAVRISGSKSEIEGDVLAVIQGYLLMCEEEGWDDRLEKIVKPTKKSDDEWEETARGLLLSVAGELPEMIKSAIEEVMRNAKER